MVPCRKGRFTTSTIRIILPAMAHRFAELAFTPAVKAAQERHGSRASYERFAARGPANDRLGPDEVAFLAERDSFYMATVSETGWPYVQHRGGPAGFVRVLDERTIALADFRGNRQYVSVGNLGGDDRVALIFMDYPRQRRLKVLGRARIVEVADDPALLARLALPGYDARVERAMVIAVEAFDWNCPQHITPRFTEAEVLQHVAPLRARLAELEAEVARLRQAPAGSGTPGPQE
jgi:predicted pyridoxine 5'-phosphate oxidase superfamily flavin-nucleotide-binding protein